MYISCSPRSHFGLDFRKPIQKTKNQFLNYLTNVLQQRSLQSFGIGCEADCAPKMDHNDYFQLEFYFE